MDQKSYTTTVCFVTFPAGSRPPLPSSASGDPVIAQVHVRGGVICIEAVETLGGRRHQTLFEAARRVLGVAPGA